MLARLCSTVKRRTVRGEGEGGHDPGISFASCPWKSNETLMRSPPQTHMTAGRGLS